MQREPIGLELVQPTENHGDSDREEDSAPPMVAVHTHHGDQGKVCKEFVRKVKNLFMNNQISYESKFRRKDFYFLKKFQFLMVYMQARHNFSAIIVIFIAQINHKRKHLTFYIYISLCSEQKVV